MLVTLTPGYWFSLRFSFHFPCLCCTTVCVWVRRIWVWTWVDRILIQHVWIQTLVSILLVFLRICLVVFGLWKCSDDVVFLLFPFVFSDKFYDLRQCVVFFVIKLLYLSVVSVIVRIIVILLVKRRVSCIIVTSCAVLFLTLWPFQQSDVIYFMTLLTVSF